jgi:PAS domain S-box-containing protein
MSAPTSVPLRRLHRGYYLLAFFNVVTVAGSLYVGHEMIGIVRSSLQASRQSQHLLDRYSHLGRLAQQVNAPGNDVFGDAALDSHRRRFEDAAAAFARAVDAERQELSRLPRDGQQTLRRHLDDVQTAMAAMVAHERTVFQLLGNGRADAAIREMAAMDRQYVSVAGHLQNLRDDAVRLQAEGLDEQEREAADRLWYELALAFAVLVMVAAVAVYGQQLSARLQRVETERAEHVRELEAAQAALQQQAQELERRVEQRTAELAGVNQQLSRTANIVNSTDDAVYSTDRDGVLLSWNPAAERMFGYQAAEVLGKPAGILLAEEFRQAAHDRRASAWRSLTAEHYESSCRRKDGTIFPVSVTATAIVGAVGSVEAIGEIVRDITTEVEQRQRLVESQRHMSEAQQLANIGSWAWDTGTNKVTWSEQQFRVMGFEPGTVEASYELYMQALDPTSREAAQKAVDHALATGEPFVIQQRVIAADGSLRHVESRGKVTRAANGQIVAMTGTSQDVTAARAAERARRAAEEQFRAYVESTAEWVWALDPRGHLTYSNRAVFDILGYEPEELLGRDVRPLVEPTAREATERLLPEVIAGRQRWNGIVRRFLHKNGEWRYLESSGMPIVDENGRFVGFRGAERDITRRKLAEEALRRSEERFQLAARATDDVLWDLDVESGSIWRNDGMRRLFGHADGVQALDTWGSLLHPDDRDAVRARLEAFLASERETWTDEYRFRRGDGAYAWVLDRGIVVRHKGKAVRMIGSMIDITERKEAERMKSDFVSFVSHQLRTPLAGMNWMLELAAEAESLPRQAGEYIAEARESAARLSTLVNDLLDIARLESGRTVMLRQPVRLDELTRSVLREMQTVIDGKQHTLRLDTTAALVVGDEQMLRQVVANLLSNAIKYTPDGGRIDVRVVGRRDDVEWSVQDNGMGIPQAAQGRLFEKFYRAENAISKEAEGTGLGLHLVRLVVEHAGGQIWCDSEEGEGSRFTFTLPVVQREGVEA